MEQRQLKGHTAVQPPPSCSFQDTLNIDSLPFRTFYCDLGHYRPGPPGASESAVDMDPENSTTTDLGHLIRRLIFFGGFTSGLSRGVNVIGTPN